MKRGVTLATALLASTALASAQTFPSGGAASTSPPIIVPNTGQVITVPTPANQQALISGTNWINGRGLIGGVNWQTNYQIIHDILAGMGTWSPTGVYTPTIGGQAPAPSATTDTTNASNITSGTLPAAQLSLSGALAPGVASGSLASTPGYEPAPNIDAYGRVTSTSQQLITAIAATNGIARVLMDHFHDHFNLLDVAKCDGSTDDSTAIQAALNTQYRIEIPQGRYCAFGTSLNLTLPYQDFGGLSMYGSFLKWIGPATSDIIHVGGARQMTGTTAQGQVTLHDFSIISGTKMTAGAAIHANNVGYFKINNVRALDPNLWNGIYFDQTDYARLTNFEIQSQNDCLGVSGNGAEGAPATGPQYDLWVDGGKVGGCHIGVHVGGGFDGAFFDHIEDTTTDYSAVVDETLLDPNGGSHPNQEIFFGRHFLAGFAQWDGFYINDPKCTTRIFCSVTIDGPIAPVGYNASLGTTSNQGNTNGTPTGSFAGAAAPAGSGSAIHVVSDPNASIQIHSPYIQFVQQWALYTQDPSINVFFDRSTDANALGGGIYSTGAFNGVHGLPNFRNVSGAMLVNVFSGMTFPATTTAPVGPGAATGTLFFTAGTNPGTCALKAVAGTSATPTTVMDNIGSGC